MIFKSGIGFSMGRSNQRIYGLILNQSDDCIKYVQVKPIVGNVVTNKCYDDPDAVYETDKDNVALKDCPPPFSELSIVGKDGKVINNAYAVADMSHIKSLNKMLFETGYAEIVDDGIKISDKDMQTVKYHPWPQQLQKEKLISRGHEFDYMLGSEHDDIEIEY